MGKLLISIAAIVFLILFPIGEVLRVDLPNNTAFSGIDVGVFCFVFLGMIDFFVKKRSMPQLIKPLGFFVAICVLSLAVNFFVLKPNELFVAFLYLLRWVMYACVYVIVSQNSLLKRPLPKILLFSGIISLLVGYVQYFWYPALQNLQYLGWDIHFYRMFGGFLDPNFFGSFLVLYFLFVFNTLWIKILRFTQDDNKKRVKTCFLFCIAIGNLIAIFLTYSRSAYLMLFVGICTFLFIKGKKKWIFGGVIVILLFGLVSLFLFNKKSEGTNLFRTTSTQARVGSSARALTIFEKNPLFGVGFDAYRYAQNRYGYMQQPSQFPDHAGAGTDNSWLFVLATTGIIGFIAYVNLWSEVLSHVLGKSVGIVQWLYCSIVRMKRKEGITIRSREQGSRENNMYPATVVASSIALFIDALFINSLFYPFIMLWMWVVIGVGSKDIEKAS